MTLDHSRRDQALGIEPGPRHIIPVSGGRLAPDRDLAKCRDCQVSCQSACKTSCTVGNQRCPK
jgi:predicted ribosomally synthesized six-cysteine peptide SCIFF